MAYAETGDVLARAGLMAQAWHETSNPSFSDIERFLRARAAEIDAALASRGIAAPVTDIVPKEALRSLNAAGALVLALGASAMGQTQDAVSNLLERVQAEWDAGISAITNGTHAVVVAVEVTGASQGKANDFWSEEPGYGLDEGEAEENPFLAPYFAKGEMF